MWRNKVYGGRPVSSLRKDWRAWGIGGGTGPYITITGSSIAENAANGSSIGTLSVANPPVGHGSYVFTINSDPDNLFAVSGGVVDTNGALDYEAAQSHQVQIKADDSTTPVILQWFTITITNVAPVLSNATDTNTGQTTADLSVDTTEDNGTLYWVVTTSGTAPTAAQIIAGLDHSGVAAAASGSQAITSTGTKTVSVTGLAASTAYTAHFVHKEGAPAFANSNVISGDGFTTSGSWTPADLGSALKAWLIADTGVTLNGSTVSAWADQSGKGCDVAQSNASLQPTYDATGFNGKPTITNTGGSLISANSALAMGNATASFFMAGQMLTGTEYYGRALAYQGGNSGGDDDTSGSAGAILRQAVDNVIISFANGGTRASQAVSLATNYRIGVIYDGSAATPYLNNVAGTTGGAYSTAFAASGRLFVGNNPAGNEGWNAPISEIVITNTALSPEDRNSLDDYFKTKWGL